MSATPEQASPGGHGVEALRAATRQAHDRLDSLVDLQAWSPAVHQWWLQRMLGLHEPLEHDLGSWQSTRPAEHRVPDVKVRRRSGAIAADLRSLGLSEAEVRALPRSPRPAPATGELALGRVLGQLYVLDGSALGGAVIAAHAISAGIPQEACTSLSHSKERIVSWRETKRLLDDLSPEELSEAVRAAIELFAVFEAWLHTPIRPHGKEQ
ncbi:biliverdin-producing heme oxygenase [Kineosporia babensis]|uniref:Biliverdin-producing heme oxygenase n=1 Tax=Kineosporia babensis TaxID=499548 RepID=A0A9X1NDM8_9ACTN|nr:biliverdin-producing heme oxygenase [Kineosporia babensis]MCD5312173.1 biliverdin-producing heme oxygenase [Kineosporia babensis]